MHPDTASEYKDWAFGAIVTALVVACFAWIYGHSDAPAQESRLASPGSVAGTTTQFPSPTVSRSVAPQSDSIAEVYKCEKDGQRIFSDQPCGPSADVVKIMAPNSMDVQDTGGLYRDSQSSRSYSPSPSRRASYADESSICQSIEAQIDAINARMRQGYASQQGEKLRSRLRQLSDERYDARCIR